MNRQNPSRTRPFIIWTLQRTGGTNLARRLFESSGLPGTDGRPLGTGSFLDAVAEPWNLHEPFNDTDNSRPFGFASADWVARGDRAALDATTEAVCAHRLPIKHCVEMVPWEVSESLAQAAMRHDYRHVFLYRRRSLNRLLSMEYARRSGVWGPSMRKLTPPKEVVFSEPLDTERLVKYERFCNRVFERTWNLLTEAGAAPLQVAYEDIYKCDNQSHVQARLQHLLSALGIAPEGGQAQLIREIVITGDQCTRDRYEAFVGIDALGKALDDVHLFTPPDDALKLSPSLMPGLPAWILRAQVDYLPEVSWHGGTTCIGGVVVLSADAPANCRLRIREHPAIDSHWSIDSPLMAQQFPLARNKSTSRYRFDKTPVRRGDTLTLQLLADDSEIDLLTLDAGALSA